MYRVTFSFWDFAGQDVYYIPHQIFLTNQAIYIVTFNMIEGIEELSKKKASITASDYLDAPPMQALK